LTKQYSLIRRTGGLLLLRRRSDIAYTDHAQSEANAGNVHRVLPVTMKMAADTLANKNRWILAHYGGMSAM
jgi:hypothetical protein